MNKKITHLENYLCTDKLEYRTNNGRTDRQTAALQFSLFQCICRLGIISERVPSYAVLKINIEQTRCLMEYMLKFIKRDNLW